MAVILQAIKPKASPSVFKQVVKALEAAQQRAAKELLADYQKTTQTWDNQPAWTVRVSRREIAVFTKSEVWNWVDKGTRPHTIRVRRAKALAFASGYTAKTRPGSIIAQPGGPSGDTRFAIEVEHPGTKPRRFSDRLRAKWKTKWPRDLQAAITKAGGRV
jgi:hypothetical protein